MIDVASIVKESSVDGEGIRYVVFTQGCKHNCIGCHNPQTHEFNCGTQIEQADILRDMESNPLIDGITFSGGDPFFQADECTILAKMCKENGYSVWAYTGFIFDDFLNFKNNCKCNSWITNDMITFLNYIDVVVDGPFIEKQKTLDAQFKGSYNQRIIDVKESLENNKIIEYTLEQGVEL